MSHVNHNGNRHVEQIADPENPIVASAEPIDNHVVDPDFDRHKGPHIKGPPGAPPMRSTWRMGGLRAAAGWSAGEAATTNLLSSEAAIKPHATPESPPASHPNPVKPPTLPKNAKPRVIIGENRTKIMAYLLCPIRYNRTRDQKKAATI
jgi:hypothetical protein